MRAVQYVYLIALGIFVAGCSGVQTNSLEAEYLRQPLQVMPELQQGVLDNGLRYYVLPYEVEEVSISMYINAGSLDERDDELGLAHLLEHMAFNGTESFTADQIDQMLLELGQEQGNDVNAWTSGDVTEYYIDLSADIGSSMNFYSLLEWYADIAHGRFSMTEAQLSIEKGIVNAERAYRADSGYWDSDYKALYQDTPLSGRDPIGNKQIIETATRAQLESFASRNYKPSNAILIVAGNIDQQQIESMKAIFSGGEKSKPSPFKTPIDTNRGTVFFEQPDAYAFTHAQLIDSANSLHTNKDWFNEYLLYALNDILQQRIVMAAEEKELLSLSSEVDLEHWENSYATYVYLEHDNDAHSEVTLLLREQLDRLAKFGLTDEEFVYLDTFFEIQKTQHITDWSPRTYVVEIYYSALANSVMFSPIEADRVTKQGLSIMGKEYINDYVQYWASRPMRWGFSGNSLDRSELVQVLTIPITLSKSPQLAAVAPIVSLPQPTKSKGSVIDQSSLINAKVITLNNGVTVILEHRAESQTVSYFMMSQGGSYGLQTDLELAASYLASDVLTMSQYDWATTSQLEGYLLNQDIAVYPYFDSFDHGLSLESPSNQTEQALNLIFALMSREQFDQKVFDQVKASTIDEFNSWDSIDQFFIAMDDARYHGHSIYSRLNESLLEEVESTDVLALYNAYYRNVDGYVLSIVGNFDSQTIIDQLETYIGGLQQGVAYEFSAIPDYQAPTITRIERSGAEPEQSLVLYGYVTPKSEEVGFVEQATAAIAVSIAQERLERELRESKGWVYGVDEYSTIGYGRIPETTVDFEMYTDPQNTEVLIGEIETIIADLLSHGVTDEEFERHMAIYVSQLQASMDDEYTMAFLYADNYLNGIDSIDMLNYPIMLMQIDKHAVNQRLQLLFAEQGLSIGVLTE
jgi:zinc protease